MLEVADGELVRHTDLVIDERTGVLLADWAALQHLPGRKELFYRAQQAVGAFSLCYVLVHGQVPRSEANLARKRRTKLLVLFVCLTAAFANP